MKNLSIFGIQLTATPMVELRDILALYLSEARFHHIVTVNPEMLLYASSHPGYRALIEQASLRVVDGAGISFVGRLRGYLVSFADRATGVDITHYLLGRAIEQTLRVMIILPQKTFKTKEEIVAGLAAQYPGLAFRILQEGTAGVEDILQDFDPDIIFTAQGVPRQEEWIEEHRARLEGVKIAMGVGGTFDFLSGTMQRAPAFMRALGLEWLFRLMREPKRFKRIFRATVVFPIKALLYR